MFWSAPKGSADDVSFEIRACYQPMSGGLPGLTEAEKQVFACLNAHRAYIVDAERKFGVTRLAIAGAIAQEMLENVHSSSARAVGFGKVHWFNISWSPKRTAASQVEELGYLPKRSLTERKVVLMSPQGAIQYIGAIMAAIAEAAVRHGFADLRDNPEILTNVYQGLDLDQWEEHLADKAAGTGFSGGNSMDIWVVNHLDFLTAAVGKSKVPATPTMVPDSFAPGGKKMKVFDGLTLSDLAQSEYGDWQLWPLLYDRNKDVIGGNPDKLRIGQVLKIVPLKCFAAAQLEGARKRAAARKMAP